MSRLVKLNVKPSNQDITIYFRYLLLTSDVN